MATTRTAAAVPADAPASRRRVDRAAEDAPVAGTGTGTGDERQVTAALNHYARAYEQLDASAARAVWPSVDERALSNAFAGLASQNLDFEDCAIDVRGASANAVCRGTASYVTKVGNDHLRVEPRTWRFELRRDGEAWTIAKATAQR